MILKVKGRRSAKRSESSSMIKPFSKKYQISQKSTSWDRPKNTGKLNKKSKRS